MRAESKSPERSVRERERERRSREMGRNQQRANPINRTQSAAQVRAVHGDGGHDHDHDRIVTMMALGMVMVGTLIN